MSGAAGTYVPIPAPLATPPRLGLLTAAQFPDGVDPRWINGFSFRPDWCAPGGGTYWCAPDDPTPPANVPATLPDTVQVRPVAVTVTGTCSSLDFGTADLDARVRRAMLAAESRLIEAEFWGGDLADAAGFPNQWLTDGGATDLGEVPGFYALAELQQWAADAFDERAMIHARPRVVEFWWRNDELRREGNLLLDAFDNIVVPGGGYTGRGPNDEAPDPGVTEWAFVTPTVYVLRDAQVTITPGADAEAIDRASNDRTFTASKVVAAYHSGCGVAAVNVNLAAPCVA